MGIAGNMIKTFTGASKEEYSFKKDNTARKNMSLEKKIKFFTDYMRFVKKLVEECIRPLKEDEIIDVMEIKVKRDILHPLDTMLYSVSPLDALNYGLARPEEGQKLDVSFGKKVIKKQVQDKGEVTDEV